MTRRFDISPSLSEIEALARAALERLPEPFAAHLEGVALLVEDFADEETLAAMGIEDPFALTGIYEGFRWARRDPTIRAHCPTGSGCSARRSSTSGSSGATRRSSIWWRMC